MKVLLNLCLLFSLISPVVLLICKNCANFKGTQCAKEVNQECSPDSACRNSIARSNVFLNRKMARKSCTDSTRCDPGYYSIITSRGGFLMVLVDCCTEDNCNSKNLEFSSEPMEPNGLECEGVKCLGDHTKCISMQLNYIAIATTIEKVFRTKGCATPLMCDKQKVIRNMRGEFLGMTSLQVNCTDAILSPNA